MGYSKLSSEQIRVSINAVQIFEALEQHRRQAKSVAGSMHWKRIGGKEYLYRAYSYGRNSSLGPRSEQTESIKAQFEQHRADYDEREKALRDSLRTHAAYVRANRLNRFPEAGARVIRALQRQGVPFRVIGTNAMYAFEARAGVQFESAHLATEDMDVMLDARQGMRIVAELKDRKFMDILKASDQSFSKISSSNMEFCAANKHGYRIDFITQGNQNPVSQNDFEKLLDGDDLVPVTIESLKWQVCSPPFEAVVFDEKGSPVRISTVDPRAFVLHKWYAGHQPDREAMKRNRDIDQARLVTTLIRQEMPDMPEKRAIRWLFPKEVSLGAEQGIGYDDYDV